MLALGLALGSSACWGVSDFLGGLQSRRRPLLTVMLVSQGAALLGLIVLVAVRGVAPPHLVKLAPALGGGAAGMIGLSAFYRGLSIGTMSIVAPISATGAAIPVVVGLAQGERPAPLQLIGIAAAIAGVVLASREDDAALAHETRAKSAVVLALVAAAGFGTFFVGLRSSARFDVPWALVAGRVGGVALLLAALALRRPPGVADPRGILPLAVVGLLDLAANGLYALATRHGLLSVVAVASSLYPLGTVVLARLLLGERVRRVQEVGIVAALTGVVLIAAG